MTHLQQVIAVEGTQELEQCRRCLIASLDKVLSDLHAARVRVLSKASSPMYGSAARTSIPCIRGPSNMPSNFCQL